MCLFPLQDLVQNPLSAMLLHEKYEGHHIVQVYTYTSIGSKDVWPWSDADREYPFQNLGRNMASEV